MVLLRVITSREEQLESIVKLLLQEKLAVNVTLKHPIIEYVLEGDLLHKVTKYIIVAKTKSLLFPVIEKAITKLFPHNTPEMYSLAIVHMDWRETEKLSNEVKKV